MNSEIVYWLGDKAVVHRLTPYNVCFDVHRDISIRIDGVIDTRNMVLAIRIKDNDRIKRIKANADGEFIIPSAYFIINSILLMNLVLFDDNDEIVSGWLLEPLHIVSLDNKANEIVTSLQNYDSIADRVAKLERLSIDDSTAIKSLIVELDRLSERVTTLERMLDDPSIA